MVQADTDGGMNHGVYLRNLGGDPDTLVEYAVAADEAGWDGVFLADHLIDWEAAGPADHRPIADPWTTLAGVATRTEHVTLGTWITPIPRRQPWQLARDLATLDQLSDGRVLLGAGLGSPDDFTRFGQPYDQKLLAEKYDEALEVITGLWSGNPFSYDGDHFTVDEAVLRPAPVQEPRIPIVIGGWWPHKKPFQRGARWDGIMPNWPSMLQEFSQDETEEHPDHIQRAMAHQQSHEEEVREMVEYYCALTDDPGEIVLIDVPSTPPDFSDICRDLGATWLLDLVDASATPAENVERIRDGPPN